jgi:hypothetical protein
MHAGKTLANTEPFADSVDFEDGESVLQLKARVARARGYDDSEEVKAHWLLCYLFLL